MAACNWRETLLETPSGFALFAVDEDVLKETNDIWVYFRNISTAKQIMFRVGDVQFADKSVAWDGETEASRDLMRLIRKFCKNKKDLIVQSVELKAVIEKKLKIQCSYQPPVVDELIWGMKHVLRGFISYEDDNITKEYCLPLSKGLQQFLQDHLINVEPEMLHNNFISEIGLLRYFDTTLEQVPKALRDSFDDHVLGIGKSIEDDLEYARVLASILVDKLAPKYDFSKMFPSDLALKIDEAKKHATKYRDEELTMHDREIIMGALSHLLAVPKQRNEIMIRVKRMESEITYHLRRFECPDEQSIREPANFNDSSTYRRTLLETPSGFAIFDVCEDVFTWPQRIWTSFITATEALGVVLALGFVKIRDKSIVRDNCHGPGQDLSRLIRKLCPHGTKLIVQDDDLKSVIEDKLKVKCCTKFPNDDDGVADLMWGLKHVLHEFIPQEKDNLTDEYCLPMSKGLQNMLQSYGVNASLGQMDKQSLFVLGYLEHLDWVSSVVPLIFRQSFDPHVSYIGTLIEDHVDYANMVAHILVPESEQKIDVKSLSNVLKQKVAQLAENVNKQGKSINDHDKQVILAVCSYLSDVREKKDKCLQFLKRNGSEVELPRVGVAWCSKKKKRVGVACGDEVNSWLVSLTKASPSEKLTVADMPIVPCQMGGEGQDDNEGTKAPKKAAQEARNTFTEAENTGKNKSGKDKSAQAYDSFDKVPNVEDLVDPSTGKSVGTDADLVKFTCHSEAPSIVKPQQQLYSIPDAADHLAISQEADNANQHHYPVTAIKTMNVCSSVTMDNSMLKDMSSGMDLSISATAYEVNIVGRTNFVDTQNGNGGTGGTFDETNERHIVENFEEKQQCREAFAVPIPDKTDVIFTMDNSQENEQNETDASSCKIGPKQCISSSKDNEQTYTTGNDDKINVTSKINIRKRKDKGSADPTSHKTNGVYTIGNDDELKNGEPIVDPTFSIGTICSIDDVEVNKQGESTTEHPCGENNTLVGADDRLVYSVDVNDKAYEQTIAVPTSHEFSFVTSDYSADRKDEETKGCTTDEQKSGETLVDSTSSIGKCRIHDDEDKKQSEATTDHSSSCQNNMQQGTDDTGYKKQNAGTIAGPASDETKAANVSFKERMEDTASEAINTDQSEDEIKVANVFDEGRMGGTTLNENSDHGSKGANESEVTGKCRIHDDEDKHSEETTDHPSLCQNNMQQGTNDTGYKKQNAGTIAGLASDETKAATVSFKERMEDTASKAISTDQSADEIKVANAFDEGRMGGTTLNENSDHGSKGGDESEVTSKCRIHDDEDNKRSEETTGHPSLCRNNTQQGTDDTGYKKQHAGTIAGPASDETKVATVSVKERMEDAASMAIYTDQSEDEIKVANVFDEGRIGGTTLNKNSDHGSKGAAESEVTSGRIRITLQDLLGQENNEVLGNKDTKIAGNNEVSENNDTKKKGIKNWFVSFRSRSSSKDNLSSSAYSKGSSSRFPSTDNVPSSSKAAGLKYNRFRSMISKRGNRNN